MENKTDKNYQVKVILAFFAIYMVWGSSFSMVTIALKTFPPMVLNTFRFLIGGILMGIYSILKKESLPGKAEIFKYMLTGIIIFFGGVVAVAWAQQFISSSLASIIITTPFWFVMLDKRSWKINFTSPYIVSGMLLSLTGVLLLVTNKQNYSLSGNNDSIFAILIIVFGSLLWVMGSLYLKYNPGKASIFVRTSIQLLSAAAFCLVICLGNDDFSDVLWNEIDVTSVLALLYLSIISTTLTFMAFMWLMEHKTPTLVSTYSYVNPIVAVLLGFFFLHDEIVLIQIISMIIILFGVFMINLPKYKFRTVIK